MDAYIDWERDVFPAGLYFMPLWEMRAEGYGLTQIATEDGLLIAKEVPLCVARRLVCDHNAATRARRARVRERKRTTKAITVKRAAPTARSRA